MRAGKFVLVEERIVVHDIGFKTFRKTVDTFGSPKKF